MAYVCWEWDYGNAVGYNGEAGCYYKSSMVAECGGSTQEKTGVLKKGKDSVEESVVPYSAMSDWGTQALKTHHSPYDS